MSHLLTCKSLSKSFGVQTLFADIDLVISSGDRIGLIGPNGSGKSTLLKILCGLEETDEGTLLAAKNLQVGYLAQSDEFDNELSLFDALRQALEGSELDEQEIQTKVSIILSKAEFADEKQLVRMLSGGWRKRLAICRALLVEPDLLVLDEPTNHLDLEGIIWLEKLIGGGLAEGPDAFVIVSHDRQFLENSCNRIVELSSVYPKGSFQVDGAYSAFLEKREQYLQQQEEFEVRLSNKVRRETEWLRRGPKARTSKARYRIDEAHRLQDELGDVRQRNRSTGTVGIDFDSTGRKTKKLLEGEGLAKSFGDKRLFSGLDILLSPGTRLGLLGRNGCGKSTLMQILAAGEEARENLLDSGWIKTADNVRIVQFEQDRSSLDAALTLRRSLAPEGDSVVFQGRSLHVVSWAKRFQFRADQLETPVGELSGGEQARILIAGLMLQPADILLLDEPTNDLDIGSLDVLEESLADFPGALVLVTHDRYLLDRVCSRLLGFDGQGDVAYYADYQQWLDHMGEMEKPLKPVKNNRKEKDQGKKEKSMAGRLSYLDQREYDGMEEKIEMAEARQEELEQKVADPEIASNPDELDRYWKELEETREEVERLYARWGELEEKKLAP